MLSLLLILALEGDVVPFELRDGLVVVEARVNGQGPCSLVFDTGARVTTLHPRVAEKLGVPSGAKVQLALGKAATEVSVEVAAGSYDGVLGGDYISRFVTTLDYRKRTIHLVPVDAKPYVGLSPRALGADEANEIGVDGGIVVHRIAKGSPAEKAGLREKDIVQEIGPRRILSIDDYDAVVRASAPGDTLVFRVIRDRKDLEMKVTVSAR